MECYLSRREGTETFLQFSRRLSDQELQTLLPQDLQYAA
jgi:hypothetical protein